jgi:6,7-dimethyl-8-ribityllumazine synthase
MALPDRPPKGMEEWRILIVASEYNGFFVQGLVDHAVQEICAIAPGTTTTLVRVPGSFEIPLAVQVGLSRLHPSAVLAFGVIFDGETLHASLIAGAVTEALMQLSLNSEVPIFHEVLVVQDEDQARARCISPELNRGTEAARASARMLRALAGLAKKGHDG